MQAINLDLSGASEWIQIHEAHLGARCLNSVNKQPGEFQFFDWIQSFEILPDGQYL